jgi:hypothetical protein
MAKKNIPTARKIPVTKNVTAAKKTSVTTKNAAAFTAPKRKISSKALRFAHPFFTTTPKSKRRSVPGVGNGLSNYPSHAGLLLPIPPPHRNPTMTLDEIIGTNGVAQIKHAGSMTFHATGDTGSPDTMTELVSGAMATDYDAAHPETSPAFLLHLGDLIYYNNTDQGYLSQFYTPYKKYPGKIIAIPGNHDGELFKYDGTPYRPEGHVGRYPGEFLPGGNRRATCGCNHLPRNDKPACSLLVS